MLKKLERCLSITTTKKSSSNKILNSMLKKLERCLSITTTKKSSSSRGRVAPTGCVSVYVGPEKQRFVIKAEFINHPLFKILLEDAELEYGFANNGPLLIPCQVHLFYKVLAQMDCGDYDDDDDDEGQQGNFNHRPNCGFSYGSCSPFSSPARRSFGKGYSSYHLQTPSRFVKINHF